METLLIITATALWGGGAGVLIPRPAYRFSVTPEEPWRSACPAGHPLTGTGRGWLGRARCAAGDTFGPSALAVAFATTAVCVLLATTTGARPELVVWLLLAPAGVLLAAVDFTAHRLPDVLTLPLAAAALALLGVAAMLPSAGGSWTSALLGSLIVGACYLVLFLLSKGFGFGDVKLALVLGAVLGWYGWAIVVVGTFAGYLLGALYGIVLIVTGRGSRKTRIPFGPLLLAGAFAGVLLGSYTR
ncbi:prepilin peptidase [Streptomyces rishiriensis]|uniref:Leader peptidase (Prepilin peptidase)/N-methyltransferase n=1 Tax=Streptomyces rishiriensis TaxID=68264 RepID=A0ABU0NGR4_STRRH|nr:A24 family peptidase [Streptomyces rishiriensis]MDQ0578250.1 leader peptidase (prepilin peptidase)/N-methyltransferase [Streptomyces rishiriensis]